MEATWPRSSRRTRQCGSAAAGDGSPDSKRAVITEAFRAFDPYVHRFGLSLLAPADVVEDAVAVFRRTREIRDLLISV